MAQERLRIAREVHDEVAHSISALSLQAQVARRAVAAGGTVAEADLRTIEETAQGAMDDLRRIPQLAALMLPVALGVGVNSEAANMAGPAADPEAWSWRKVTAKQGGPWHLSLVEDDDDN